MNQQFINDLAERVLKSASLKPVGETWISFDGTIPFGGIPFLGGSYSKELYKDLYTYAKASNKVITEEEWQKKNKEQNGNVPFYSDVSSTEFRVPRINGYFKGSDSIGETGKYIPEGLPNPLIAFKLSSASANNMYHYYGDIRKDGTVAFGAATTDYNAKFMDQNLVDNLNIYGASEHVTPETIQVLVGVYAFGTVRNVGNIDVGQLTTEVGQLTTEVGQLTTEVDSLTQKVNGVGDLIEQNKPKAYIVETWSDGNSWYRKYSDGWVEQGAVSTAYSSSSTEVTFFKPYTMEMPFVAVTPVEYTAKYTVVGTVRSKTVTKLGFSCAQYDTSGNNRQGGKISWYACGY